MARPSPGPTLAGSRSISGRLALPSPRLLALVGPTCVAGIATVAVAAVVFLTSQPTLGALAGFGVLLAASAFAERFPVPIENMDAGGVSLSFVFGVAAIVLYGWAPGVIVCFGGAAITQLLEGRQVIRVAYNASSYALAALATGSALTLLEGGGSGALVARASVAGAVQYSVNIALVGSVVAVHSRRSLTGTLLSSARGTIVPFTLMTSTALVLVVLWQRSPYFAAALIGPLLTLGLYQRSNFRALKAIRESLTDPLTGLGNLRAFHESLDREMERARETGTALTLCLLDVDDLKRVNDRFGHPAGDDLLIRVARRLRQGGETFRWGGDEFAILLPGQDERAGLVTATNIAERMSELRTEKSPTVSVSAGLVTFPSQSADHDELIRLADEALYRAKAYGKNRVAAAARGVTTGSAPATA
jgi:diguanylate cyclase (GGDEF)-like protein